MCQTIDEYAEKYAKAYGQECEARGISIGRNEGISIGRQEERNDLLTQMIANGDLAAALAAKYQVSY